MDTVQQLINAFDQTGVKFHDRSSALEQFRENHEIDHNDDGAFADYDGERLSLKDALTRFAYDRRDLVDGRTLPRNGAGAGRPGLASKADFRTAADKAKFIAESGLEAWERLPSQGVSTSEVLTQADWMKLPRTEKVRRLAADPDAFNRLPPAPRESQPFGGFVNHAALERQKQIRGR